MDSSSDDDDVIEAVISKNTGQDSGNQHFSKSLNDRDLAFAGQELMLKCKVGFKS